ncbi:ComEC/Rec2 family competence protein [Acrocarpospora pleiomorpha]|uniref:ComEC/Rec2 family competence protein n=1 Tax=Acrocarpospora pleiomorpha TaxID=90975 RepID=UPI0031E1ED95
MVTDAVAARNAPEADVSEVGVRGAVGVDSPVVVTDVGAARKAPKADVSEVGVRGGAGADSNVVVNGVGVGSAVGVVGVRVDSPVVVFGVGEEWLGLLPSQRVRVVGRLAVAELGGLKAGVLVVRGVPVVVGGPSAVQDVAGVLRNGLRVACEVLPPGARGLLPGLVVGDVSRLDAQVKEDFADAGLSHLNAVSGANLAIVAGAVLVVGRFAGLPLVARGALVVVAMGGFAVVARPSPSVLRALVMGTVAAIALGTGRSRDGMAALSGTVLLLILFNPGLAREYGFALSVAATGGILVLAPRWRDRMAVRMPAWMAEAIAVPAAAQAAVTPLLVLMSGELGLAAIPANLLAAPAVAPATVLGFLAALIAPISMDLAQLIVRPAGLSASWIITVAEWAAELPLATVGWPAGMLGLVLLAAISVAVWLVLRRQTGRRLAIALAGGSLIAVLLVGPATSTWPARGWLLVMCDVGQGDALVLSAGEGKAVVVDAGPEPGPVDRCLRRLDVHTVPLLVLTHPHLDHVGGLTGVLRNRRIGAVVVSPIRVSQRESTRVSTELRTRKIPEWVVRPGTRWHFGQAEITVLAPNAEDPIQGQGEGSMTNNASVVLLVRWPTGSALLAGDLETEAEDTLLRTGVPPVDILKVPHHGSGRQSPAFLAATRSRAALISVGADNNYGHPAQTTISRLTWLGTRVYRTDRAGDLAVIPHQGRLAVVPRGTS